MSVCNFADFDISNIKIKDPIKHEKLYISSVLYNDNSLIIQTPKLKINKIDSDSIDVIINKDFMKLINEFDKFIISVISVNSEQWFSQKLDINKVSKIYKRNILHNLDKDEEMIMSFKMSDNIQIYGKNKVKIELDDIKVNQDVILLINCPYLIFYKSNFISYWEILHMKIKEEKIVKTYEFRQTEDAEGEDNDTKISSLKLDELNI
jgi:hypothetical protein